MGATPSASPGGSASPPRVRVALPDGRRCDLYPDAILGRSPAADLRLADPRISSVHAELSWRAEGPTLLARGGRLLVANRPQAEVALAPGLRITLAPGLELLVEDIIDGEVAPVAPTLGREGITWRVDAAFVTVEAPGGAPIQVAGLAARLLATCLRAGAAVPWVEVAARLWPEEARVRAGLDETSRWTEDDERRLRNRWDQLVRATRQQLAPRGLDARLLCGAGTVRLHVDARDTVVDEDEGAAEGGAEAAG